MARKIKLNGQFSKTLAEVFDDFVLSQTAKGLSDITLSTYRHHLHSISNHLDIQKPMDTLTRKDLEAMVVSMRVAGLAHNSISSYCRVLRTFLNWCKRAGLNIPELPNIKDRETVKETYTDAELMALLERPKKNCSFCEYRNWVIVNFLMNSGCRSSSVRNIQIRDVDLDARQIILRHNKNGKIQSVPLCSLMVSILREYLPIRGGKLDDYLFCDQYGGMLSMNGLRLAVARHNQSRGIEKTSAHLYRHTFARKYLVDCGGDAFMLQKLLGHSTLKMTKHYCAIYDADIAKDYDRFSPLAQMNQPKEKIRKRR
jgi:integrase/recombinase XerD